MYKLSWQANLVSLGPNPSITWAFWGHLAKVGLVWLTRKDCPGVLEWNKTVRWAKVFWKCDTWADFSNDKYHGWKIQTFGFQQLSCLPVVATSGDYIQIEMSVPCSTLIMLSYSSASTCIATKTLHSPRAVLQIKSQWTLFCSSVQTT